MAASPDPENILVIKPSSLGDVVHTLPAVGALRDRWPAAKITWVVQPAFAPLLCDNPDIHAIILFPRAEFRGPSGVLRFLKWLSHFEPRGWDMAIDFQGLLRSALIGRAARPTWFVGPIDAREGARWFYDHYERGSGQHAVERNLTVAMAAGAPRPKELRFSLPEAPGPRVIAGLDYVALHPYSRGSGKALPEAILRKLIEKLAPVPVVIVGKGEALAAVPSHVTDLTNQTSLPELVAVLRDARAVISVDSGPMHLAAAVNRKVLAIHTWSHPARVGPWQHSALAWRAGKIAAREEHDPQLQGRQPEESELTQIVEWCQ